MRVWWLVGILLAIFGLFAWQEYARTERATVDLVIPQNAPKR